LDEVLLQAFALSRARSWLRRSALKTSFLCRSTFGLGWKLPALANKAGLKGLVENAGSQSFGHKLKLFDCLKLDSLVGCHTLVFCTPKIKKG